MKNISPSLEKCEPKAVDQQVDDDLTATRIQPLTIALGTSKSPLVVRLECPELIRALMASKEEKKVYTSEEAMQLLGIKKTKYYQLMNDPACEIPRFKMGDQTVHLVKQFDAWMEAESKRQTSDATRRSRSCPR